MSITGVKILTVLLTYLYSGFVLYSRLNEIKPRYCIFLRYVNRRIWFAALMTKYENQFIYKNTLYKTISGRED